MRVLMANYRYFVSSGPERYLFNVMPRLEAMGHEVVPFSIKYARNAPSAYDRYFVSPLAGEDAVFFEEHRQTAATVIKTLSRLFYSGEVEQAVERLIDETKPDLAYVLYYLRKLSPSLLVGIKKRKLPLVVRISDYGMMCGEHHMLRDGRPCTKCLDSGLHNQVVHRCIKGSLPISALDAMATAVHRARGYFDLIDHFVTTNAFMSEMMVRSGVSPSRITCIPTFTDVDAFTPSPTGPAEPPYLIYVGRIDEPKGVHVLLEAMRLLRDRLGDQTPLLKLAGSGHTGAYVQSLHDKAAAQGLGEIVQFLGAVPASDVAGLFRGAYAAMMPALWFENLPNSVVESFASGCPVIASNLGSLSFTVDDGVNGLLVPPDDAVVLADAIERVVRDRPLRDALAAGARDAAETKFSPESHMRELTNLFGALTGAPAMNGAAIQDNAVELDKREFQ